MNVNKAIKKQNKSYKRFLLFNCFIFLALPLMLYFSRQYNFFYIAYLLIIEVLILFAIIAAVNNNKLSFNYDGLKLKLSWGIWGKKLIINCDKVVFVHSKKNDDIIIISTSRFRSNIMRKIDMKFLKNNPYAAYYYYKIKAQCPEKNYYYVIIKSGGIYRYELLDTLYKSCVYAQYTDDAIDKIKIFRDSEH